MFNFKVLAAVLVLALVAFTAVGFYVQISPSQLHKATTSAAGTYTWDVSNKIAGYYVLGTQGYLSTGSDTLDTITTVVSIKNPIDGTWIEVDTVTTTTKWTTTPIRLSANDTGTFPIKLNGVKFTTSASVVDTADTWKVGVFIMGEDN